HSADPRGEPRTAVLKRRPWHLRSAGRCGCAAPPFHIRLLIDAGWETGRRLPEIPRRRWCSREYVDIYGRRARPPAVGKNRTPYRDRPLNGADSIGARLLFLAAQETPQVDVRNGLGCLLKALPHLHPAADLLDPVGGNMNGFRLALDQHGELELGVQVLALSAAAIGFSALAVTHHQRTGQHLAPAAQAAEQPAPLLEFRVGRHKFCLTLIIVSEMKESKGPRSFARMTVSRNCQVRPSASITYNWKEQRFAKSLDGYPLHSPGQPHIVVSVC